MRERVTKMEPVYWLDPLNRRRLLEAIFGIFANGSRVAIEGDAVLAGLELSRLAGTPT